MRAFNRRYPRTLPTGATHSGATYIIEFVAGTPHRATFAEDGTFVSDDLVK
jgi:hypothetical protein